jgi:hypothetical protein
MVGTRFSIKPLMINLKPQPVPAMSSDSTPNNSNNTYHGSYTVGGTYNTVVRDQYNSNNSTTVNYTGPTAYYTKKKDVRTGDITSTTYPLE